MTPLRAVSTSIDSTIAGGMTRRSRDALEAVVANTAGGRVIEGVDRCLLRIDAPWCPDGWTASSSTHPGDRGAPDVDVAFRLASVSKMMTATALLVLCDQGHCRLDDVVGAYLGGDVLDRFRDSDQRPYAAGLTLRQLLDHTSGLPNYFLQPVVMDAVLHGDGRRRFTPADLLDLAARSTPPSSPGAAQVYTDTGFLLAALIIEFLTGGPLQDAYRTLILDPVGMADTWLESSSEPPRRATVAQHGIQGHDITGMDPTVDWAGGGLVSTAADLGAFIRALAHGRLLTSCAWSAMTRWRSGPAGYYDDYGLGLGRYRFRGAQAIGHHGVWGAFAFWCPELDATITGTVSTGKVDRRPLLAAVVDALGTET